MLRTNAQGVPAMRAAGYGRIFNALSRELAQSGVEMTPGHVAASKVRIPMGRLLTVEEIAAMVAWIAGPECSFTTGFTFDLSGGRANY